MEKPKRSTVSPEMRKRLFVNAQGRLLPSQWIDLATESVLGLMALAVLGMFVFGPAVLWSAVRSWWIWGTVIFFVVIVPILLRAMRYARLPVHFARLSAGESHQPVWGFWRPIEFRADDQEVLRFTRRLAPRGIIMPNHEYLVYYLDDPAGRVLLSFAPAEHEDAPLWEPSELFKSRFARRMGKP